MKPMAMGNKTLTLGKPRNMTEEECGSLDVLIIPLDGHPGIASVISIWHPSPAELAALNAGGNVRLAIITDPRGVPPALVTVQDAAGYTVEG